MQPSITFFPAILRGSWATHYKLLWFRFTIYCCYQFLYAQQLFQKIYCSYTRQREPHYYKITKNVSTIDPLKVLFLQVVCHFLWKFERRCLRKHPCKNERVATTISCFSDWSCMIKCFDTCDQHAPYSDCRYFSSLAIWHQSFFSLSYKIA